MSTLTPPTIVLPSLLNLVDRHLPSSFRRANGENDNAIEYRNIMVIGGQGSGKTTVSKTLAFALTQKYGFDRVYSTIEVGGIGALLHVSTRIPADVHFMTGEDLTLAKIPPTALNQFFQVRNLIMERTGRNTGLAITAFNTHTLHGMEKNLRDTFDIMILKSVPTNPYDRSILAKKYFRKPWVDPEDPTTKKTILDYFEKYGGIDDALVWDKWNNSGTLAKVPLAGTDVLHYVNVNNSSELWWVPLGTATFVALLFIAILSVLMGWL